LFYRFYTIYTIIITITQPEKETLSLNEDSYHLHQIQMNLIHFSRITSL
jgi:hypothetical protein